MYTCLRGTKTCGTEQEIILSKEITTIIYITWNS